MTKERQKEINDSSTFLELRSNRVIRHRRKTHHSWCTHHLAENNFSCSKEQGNRLQFPWRWRSRRLSSENMFFWSFRTLFLKAVKNVIVLKSRTYCLDSTKKKWKIMFFGTDDFALKSLKELHKAMLVDAGPWLHRFNIFYLLCIVYVYINFRLFRHEGRMVSELSVVVPAPKPHPCLVAKYAMKHNLPISVWPLPKEQPPTDCWELGVVASFGHLIPKRIINSFPQ